MSEREPAEPEKPDESQEERALRAIRNINAGANVAYEASLLANEFTDSHTARFAAWLRRVFGRPSN